MKFSAIASKDDFQAYFGSDWALKRGFPFKCFYTETNLPSNLFEYSNSDPCYPFGQCMFEKWGIIDVGTEFTYTTDCLEDIYTEDLNGGNTGIGW